MDQTPFKNSSFDLITTAGSVSYTNNKYLMKEVMRLLNKNGKFICVDTINSNPFTFFLGYQYIIIKKIINNFS